MKKVMTILLIGLTLLIGTTGCTEEEVSGSKTNSSMSSNSEKKESKREFEQNEAVTHKEVQYTITNVEKSSGKDWSTPSEGKEYVIVTVKIENKSKEKISYNTYDWKMQNSVGQEDSSTYTSIDRDTNLSSGDLIAGGLKEGTIVFEQPIGDTELKLNYYGNMFSDKYAFQFKLN